MGASHLPHSSELLGANTLGRTKSNDVKLSEERHQAQLHEERQVQQEEMEELVRMTRTLKEQFLATKKTLDGDLEVTDISAIP